MAISIPVSATADDRTFQQIANKYERWGKDTGKKIGAALGDGIDDPKIEKAFSKVSDAMSKVRAEEAKLQDLRDKGASNSRIVAQSESLVRARNAEVRATNDAVRAYDGLAGSTSRLSSLTSGLTSALSGTRFGALAGDVQNLSSKFGGMGLAAGGAVAGVAAIAVGAVAAGKALYDMGAMWDNVGDKIAMRTGKFGADLQAITDSVKRVAQDTAAPIEKIGDISGQVVQSLQLTGPALDDMTQRLAILDEAGNGVGVRDLAKTFRLFGVEAQDQVASLDQLFNVSQKTGIPMQELVTNLTSAGRASKEFGLDLGQTAGLLASFEQAGLDASKITPALTIALKGFAKDGKEAGPALAEVVQRIQDMADAGNNAGAASLAAATFGKGYIDILNAIKGHELDIDKITQSFNAQGESITAAADKTADLSEEWQKLTNTLSTTFEPAATKVFESVNWQITGLIENTKQLGGFISDLFNGFGRFDPPATIAGGGEANAQRARRGLPPVDPTGGLLGAAGGDPALSQLGGGTGVPSITGSRAGAGLGREELGLPTGGGFTFNVPAAPGGSGGSGGGGGRGGSRVAASDPLREYEKQQKDFLKAQQDAIDAQQEMWQKSADVTKNIADSMDTLSAGLDKDLGLSKGLPGLADNLVRFIGGLAAAPLMGPLAAMSAAQGGIGATGSGLMGYLGASGAFGPQFQVAGYGADGKPVSAAQAGSQPLYASPSQARQGSISGGAAGGYPGDAALLANVPAGRYSMTQAADLTKGVADCSSSVEDLVNILDGRPTGGRSMATGNASEWLTSRGFMPGMGGPGDFRVGFRNGGAAGGHMQATLPGGTPFNWGSDSSAANRGIGGTGAFDPSFTDHYYRPTGGGAAPGGGGQYAPATPEQLVQQGLLTPTLYDEGGILPPGTTVVQNNTGGNEHVVKPASSPGPGNMGGIGSAAKGPGGPGTSTGQQGATQIGGAEPHAQSGASTGAGGGLMGMATSAASMAADAFAPGSGQAVQVASQVAQRAIKLGGQLAGGGVQGLMETFLPTGGSQIANDNWLTRIGGGFAGASAQLPNLAGKNPGGDPPPQAPVQPMPIPAAPGPQKGGSDQVINNFTFNGPVPETTADHFTQNLSNSVNMPGWAH